MSPRRFAIVARRFPLQPPTPPGEDYFAELARMMAEAGWQVEILTTSRGDTTDNFCVRRFASAAAMIRHLAFARYDLVHAHSHFPPALSAGVLAQHAVFTSHSYDLPRAAWKRRLLVALMNQFDRVVALTPFERDVYRAADVSESKIVVLPLPVNVPYFAGGNGARFRTRWNIPGDAPLILFVANLRSVKNPDVVARAFHSVRQEAGNARLVVIGQDTMAASFLKDDGVVFTDWQPAEVLRDALAAGKIVVNSSAHESFSLSTFEALAASRPVCLPDLGSFRSRIGSNALYHAPTDDAGLAGNILRYLREPELRRAHVTANRALVENFDAPKVLAQYRSLYQSLLEG